MHLPSPIAVFRERSYDNRIESLGYGRFANCSFIRRQRYLRYREPAGRDPNWPDNDAIWSLK
jgi:hypothetical protein